jgi:copper chaperone NosL
MKKLGIPHRVVIGIAALLFLFTFKFPFWVIYLTAPQYPEGLSLYIYLHKISGDIEIINGLNHYIGMAIIDQNDFKEFVFLPYIIAFITTSGILTAIIGSRKLLFGWTAFLLIFSMLAIYDFWHWEYTYGHNLDPDAAIQVPGMSYQPPLIGYKQLLNFGAYSYPHGGGWFYISGVVVACIVSIIVWRKSRKLNSLK